MKDGEELPTSDIDNKALEHHFGNHEAPWSPQHFTQLTAYLLTQEMLQHLKAISPNTPGHQFRCIPQAHAHACRHTRIIQKGLGCARRAMKTLMQKAIYNRWS